MTKTELSILNDVGWVELNHSTKDDELISLALSIGEIEKHNNGGKIFTLKPKDGTYSVKGTFSNRYGYGEFPLHTDMAFHTRPVRYMMLSSDMASSSRTSILSTSDIFKQLNREDKYNAQRAVYKIKTSERSFFSSLIFTELGTQGMKYDPTCMIPANKSAKDIELKLREIFAQVKPEYIEWTKGKILIIDNWRALHGRTCVNQEENRVLKRIYIN